LRAGRYHGAIASEQTLERDDAKFGIGFVKPRDFNLVSNNPDGHVSAIAKGNRFFAQPDTIEMRAKPNGKTEQHGLASLVEFGQNTRPAVPVPQSPQLK
jgi:hypothetical protein